MENIEAQAKNQLLDIQDDPQDLYFEPYKFQIQKAKVRGKKKTLKKILATCSASKFNYEEEINNKQNLKNTLKKLLEKDGKQEQLERKSLKALKKNLSSKTIKNIPSKPKLIFQKIIFDQQKGNDSSKNSYTDGTKTHGLKENKISLFELENEKIRKFIKRKMEERNFSKQARRKFTQMVDPSYENSFRQFNQKSSMSTSRLGNKSSKLKQETILLKSMANKKQKQNISAKVTGHSTPVLCEISKNRIQSRKLRNILF